VDSLSLRGCGQHNHPLIITPCGVSTTNGKGTPQGPDIVFRTLPVVAPSVETKGSGGVGASSATLYASVNPRGGSVSTCKAQRASRHRR
jgi:hypothetical protein